MKLKSMLLSGLFLIPFFSCENREETTTVDIKTELIAEISVITEPSGPIELKSQQGEELYSFTGSGIFCLAQNNELGKPMCIFQNIHPDQGCKLVFPGFEGEGNILSMQLKWDSKSSDETDFDMQNEINISSLTAIQNKGNLEINLTGIIDPLVDCIDCNPNCMYKVEIVGTADFTFPSNCLLKIPVTAESTVYSTKFALF
jgi:hypothetical protein